MTTDELVLSICASTNDFTADWKNRIKSKIATAVLYILSKYQWEFLVRYTTFNTGLNSDGNRTWTLLPEDFQKEIALRRDNLKKPLEYITPSEYNEYLSENSTPFGVEACNYTIMGDENEIRRKRIYFLDIPTSTLVIKLFYSVKVSGFSIENVPDEFIPAVESYIIFKLTPPVVNIAGVKQANPSYPYAKDDFNEALSSLIAYDEAQRGRPTNFRLDKASEIARRHFHP